MSTGLLEITATNQLFGSTVQASGNVQSCNSQIRDAYVAAGAGNALDQFCLDLSGEAGTYAATTPPTTVGGGTVVTTGTTAVTISLMAFTNFTQSGGSTLTTTWNQLIFKNLSSHDMTIQPGSSNGANMLGIPNGTPLTVRANSQVVLVSAAGETVSSSHTNITITPTSGGTMAVAFGGT